MARIAEPRPGEHISMRTLKDGTVRYMATVDVVVNEKRIVAHKTKTTLTAARTWRTETIAKLKADPRALEREKRKVPTISEMVNEHVAAKKATRRADTVMGYEWAAKRITTHAIGDMRVDCVGMTDVEKWVNDLVAKGLAKETVSRSMHLLRASLNRAMIQGHCTMNPALFVEPAGADAPDVQAFTPVEWRMLEMAASKAQYRRISWLFTLIGFRRSEVAGLQWSDVDLETGWVTVNHSRTHDVNKPKSKASARSLPLTPAQIVTLKAHRATQELVLGSVTDETYIVTNLSGRGRCADGGSPLGRPVSPDTIGGKWWNELCDLAGVPRRNLKTARSTSVTAMRNDGSPDWAVSAWHGHTEEVMRGFYTAVPKADLEAIADRAAQRNPAPEEPTTPEVPNE